MQGKGDDNRRQLHRVMVKLMAWGGILLLVLIGLRSCFA